MDTGLRFAATFYIWSVDSTRSDFRRSDWFMDRRGGNDLSR
jgi:hypothetical protein